MQFITKNYNKMKAIFIEPVGIKEKDQLAVKETLNKENIEAVFYNSQPHNKEELQNRISEADIIITSQLPISAEDLKQASNVKLINVAFTGTDHIDKEYCQKNNITVCNAAGYSTQAVAELTIGAVISLYRKFAEMEQNTRNLSTRKGYLGLELRGKTFGIVGAGAIGCRVAELASAFGCKVIAYSRTKKEINNVKFVSLDTLLQESDIVSLHLPLTNETSEIIGSNELNKMKDSAILINTARGKVVNIPELAYAINNNQIAGAAIDVYENEPPLPQDHPLLNCKNTILLPHIAFATEEAIEIRNKIIINNIVKWNSGKPENIV